MTKIWILNHYAGEMFYQKGGRHHWFAKILKEKGYETTIFASNTLHKSSKQITIEKGISITKSSEGINYNFIKTSSYKGNGVSRVRNMYSFYRNVKRTMKRKIKSGDIPDVIYASSVHPLTLVAGIKIGKKFNIPVISEVRDLWPESIVAYTKYTNKNLIVKLLYKLERWIYHKTDMLIFTMEGGKDYIVEKGWDKSKKQNVDLNKVYHINNGVLLEEFDKNIKKHKFEDEDLKSDRFKVVYTGSIRTANNVQKIIDTAKIVEKIDSNILFLIYGSGDDLPRLKKHVKTNNIKNVKFKGSVKKSEIPYILSRSNLNIFHYKWNHTTKYGGSQNKLFEYLASGTPTLSDIEWGYDIIKKYSAGLVNNEATSKEWAKDILNIKNMPKEQYDLMCDNARKGAKDYDFKILTNKLINIIENGD